MDLPVFKSKPKSEQQQVVVLISFLHEFLVLHLQSFKIAHHLRDRLPHWKAAVRLVQNGRQLSALEKSCHQFCPLSVPCHDASTWLPRDISSGDCFMVCSCGDAAGMQKASWHTLLQLCASWKFPAMLPEHGMVGTSRNVVSIQKSSFQTLCWCLVNVSKAGVFGCFAWGQCYMQV